MSGFLALVSKRDKIFLRNKLYLFMFSKSMILWHFWRVSIALTALDFANKPNLNYLWHSASLCHGYSYEFSTKMKLIFLRTTVSCSTALSVADN